MNISAPLNMNLEPTAMALLRQLQRLLPSPAVDLWLVGGTIRDLLEGLKPQDFDLAFATNLTPQLKTWAKQQGGNWFWLDKSRNQSRVLFSKDRLQFDFAPLRAENIAADLALRDFTLNALAVSFLDVFALQKRLIDPLGGNKDLKQGILRSCGATVLADDPLRILKGIRHYAQRGWQIDTQTVRQMSASAPRLLTVAGERIRNELGQILASPRAFSALEFMREHGILGLFFPGISERKSAQLAPLIDRMDHLKQRVCFNTLLLKPLEEGLDCQSILILAVLLKPAFSPSVIEQVSQSLSLSNRSSALLQTLCSTQPSLADFEKSETPRVAALKLETLGINCVELVFFALLNADNNNQELPVAEHISAYQKYFHAGRIDDLLNGREIITLTGLQPGVWVGIWQKRIKRAEITGQISSKSTAVAWLLEQFSD